MTGLNGKQLSANEFNGYFKDVLSGLIKKTFNPDDKLLFVTYQPDTLILDPNLVCTQTNQLLRKFKYVEVIEQTYKTSNKSYGGNYINGYHSHILIKESDYNSIKDLLHGSDIVDKVVYDLEGLTEKYLAKQAGMTYIRLLPTNNIPILPPTQETKKATQTNTLTILKRFITVVIKEFQRIIATSVLVKWVKKSNKIDSIQIFIDDT